VLDLSHLEDIFVQLPKDVCAEIEEIIEREKINMDDFIYQATINYVQYKQEITQRHEDMKKGYEEMAGINLNLCSEAFHAEEEAEAITDRIVIGV